MKYTKRVAIFVLLLAFGIAIMGCIQNFQKSNAMSNTKLTAKEIMEKVAKKYNSTKDISGEAIIIANGKQTGDLRFVIKYPNKYFIDQKDYVKVCNGKTNLTYYKQNNKLIEFILSPIDYYFCNLGKIVTKFVLQKNGNLSISSIKNISGRTYYVISATPKNKNDSGSIIWIDSKNWYPVKLVSKKGWITKNGSPINITVEYKNLSVNSGVSDSFFNFMASCLKVAAIGRAKMMEEKYNNIRDVKGIEVEITKANGKNSVEVDKFAVKKPDKYWIDNVYYTWVSDGNVSWQYNKKENTATKFVQYGGVRERTPIPNFGISILFNFKYLIRELVSSDKIKFDGIQSVSGRKCFVIETVKENKPIYKNNNYAYTTLKKIYWIDKEYWVPLKIKKEYGNTTSIIEYKNIKFNTGIPDSFFEFKPPAGVKVSESASYLKLSLGELLKKTNLVIIPTYTAGYKFNFANLYKNPYETKIQMHFSKNWDRIYIMETITKNRIPHFAPMPNSTVVNIDGTKMIVAKDRYVCFLEMRKGNFEVYIVAKLPKDELIKIGKSIIESPKWRDITS